MPVPVSGASTGTPGQAEFGPSAYELFLLEDKEEQPTVVVLPLGRGMETQISKFTEVGRGRGRDGGAPGLGALAAAAAVCVVVVVRAVWVLASSPGGNGRVRVQGGWPLL